MENIFIFLTLPIAFPMNFLIRSDLGDRIGRSFPYRPRIINWIWATWGGLFWIPCPICHRNYGGHEWGTTLMTSYSTGKGVCPKCVGEAKIQNKSNESLFRNNYSRKLNV